LRPATSVCERRKRSRGGRRRKVTWWWNKNVKKIIKHKRLLYKKWQKKDVRSKELYLTKKKEAKRALAEVMGENGKKTTEQRMCNKSEVLNRLYVMAKQSKEKRDITGMPCIKGKDGIRKVTSAKNESMEKYLEELLNQEKEWGAVLEVLKNKGPCEKVTLSGVSKGTQVHEKRKSCWTKWSNIKFTESLRHLKCNEAC